jgi:HSP20 family protein
MERMPWDPVRDLLTMQERLESLFGQAAPGWVPPVDLAELDDRYILTVELPGMHRNDVTIQFNDQLLTLRGERRCSSPSPERYQQLERGQGPFSRSFRFATAVAGDRVTATLVDGILSVVVPKLLEGRRIPVGS